MVLLFQPLTFSPRGGETGTSNIQHPTSNIQCRCDGGSAIERWVLDVGCWMFSIGPLTFILSPSRRGEETLARRECPRADSSKSVVGDDRKRKGPIALLLLVLLLI